ncbi:MAG: hypothetical protein ABSH44_17850 [Bryobacteraceae bacterium]|jgi:hypothetical protein
MNHSFGCQIGEAIAIVKDWLGFGETSSAPKTPIVCDSIPAPNGPVGCWELPERWCNHPEGPFGKPAAKMVGCCEHNMVCPVCGWGFGCFPDPCHKDAMRLTIPERKLTNPRRLVIELAVRAGEEARRLRKRIRWLEAHQEKTK